MYAKIKLSLWVISICLTHHCLSQHCWSEVWTDEFNGTTLDLTKWNYDIGDGCPGLCGWGNNEKQYYTSQTNNISVASGYLNITARYSPAVSAIADFTSAKIHTRDKYSFRYGKVEARMKLAAGIGVWPAFWMLPQPPNPNGGWPTSGEIDIMEFRGDIINRVDGTVHYGNSWPNNQHDGTSYTLSTGDFVNSFHIFSIEWEPGVIRWYVDGMLYKTETQTPNSLNPPSNNPVTWPWNENFYIILNLAVGGWYTGNPSTAAIIGGDVNWNRTIQIDYVKVYTDLSAGGLSGGISGKSSVLQNETNLIYSIPHTAGATYNWSHSSGTTLISGAGTNEITLNWNAADGVVSVTKTIACGSASYSLNVTVQPTHCGRVIEDFENIRHPSYGYISGVINTQHTNPSPNSQNSSPFCAQYFRNGSEQWDVIVLNNANLSDAAHLKTGAKRFLLDVYSNAAGRIIEITLESDVASPTNYPAGRHSNYRATTSVANAWETLEFTLNTIPDPSVPDNAVSKMVLFFAPNTLTNTTYYFDNLMIDNKPKTSFISGPASVCSGTLHYSYSVPNTTGSSFSWHIPAGANILSSNNANSVSVVFPAPTSGNITVTETNATGCSATHITKSVVASPCASVDQEYDETEIHLFPNPPTDKVFYMEDVHRCVKKIIIHSPLGEWIYEQEIKRTVTEIPVHSISTGVYFLTLELHSGKLLHKTILINP
ncbi:MAG: family 16 glycosylhydrolase [Cytophagaceae bacterium]|nr:family 16 glycosylhydrolase [Cytophagaceae bacterium]MDW8455823.1 family 16 glycosylhydrolase [Cytophagaceae bacterium]